MENKNGLNKEVGASKVANVLFRRVDYRLKDPVGLLVRYLGWGIFLLVVYLFLSGDFLPRETNAVTIWLGSYLVYLLTLELIRKARIDDYDNKYFQASRILCNIFLISWLMTISSDARLILVFTYTVPIFSATVYYFKKHGILAAFFITTIVGLFLGGVVFSDSGLKPFQFILMMGMLSGLAAAFYYFYRQQLKNSDEEAKTAGERPSVFELQTIMSLAMQFMLEQLHVQFGFMIIINPRTKKYFAHTSRGYSQLRDFPFDEIVEKCLAEWDEDSDRLPIRINKMIEDILHNKCSETTIQSVTTLPIVSSEGRLLGILNAAIDKHQNFSLIAINELKQLAYRVSVMIENFFTHRELKIRESAGQQDDPNIPAMGTEDVAIHMLLKQVRQEFHRGEKITLHKYNSDASRLEPKCCIISDATLKKTGWSKEKSRWTGKYLLQMGYGIAGHALEMREPILVHDVSQHPWYVRGDEQSSIKSLLAAPLYNPNNSEYYGTVSISSEDAPFSIEDEAKLSRLCNQTSNIIQRYRDFQIWRKQGGTLRKILEQLSSFDISKNEAELCSQIAKAAVENLGFRVARIRINKDGTLVTAAWGGLTETALKKVVIRDLPYEKLKPFLIPAYKAESSYLIRHGTPGWEELVDEYFYKPRQSMRTRNMWHPLDALITPLNGSDGNLLGILNLDIPENGLELTKQTLELIGVFANAASWVLELGRYQSHLLDQQARTQHFITTIGQQLAKGRDFASIGELVVHTGAKLLNAEGCTLYFRSGDDLELTHSTYLAHTDFIGRRRRISDQPGASISSWVAARGEPIFFNDEKHIEHYAWSRQTQHMKYLPSKKSYSILLVPIKDKENKVIGVISLENKKAVSGLSLSEQKERGAFDDDDKKLLVLLADEFAKALEVIGIYEDVKEWERLGLAEDLHDLINWYHSGVVLWIEAISAWLEKNNYEKAKELMPDLQQHALTTVSELKILHTTLSNKSFESNSLNDVLNAIVEMWTTRSTPRYNQEMKIDLQCPEDLVISPKLRNMLSRIASLAYSNAIRHSGILENPDISIRVTVEKKGNDIWLSITDNGKGVDLKSKKEGFGISRMRQLAEQLNSMAGVKTELSIDSHISVGTSVLLRLIMNQDIVTAIK